MVKNFNFYLKSLLNEIKAHVSSSRKNFTVKSTYLGKTSGPTRYLCGVQGRCCRHRLGNILDELLFHMTHHTQLRNRRMPCNYLSVDRAPGILLRNLLSYSGNNHFHTFCPLRNICLQNKKIISSKPFTRFKTYSTILLSVF